MILCTISSRGHKPKAQSRSGDAAAKVFYDAACGAVETVVAGHEKLWQARRLPFHNRWKKDVRLMVGLAPDGCDMGCMT
ncbi:hypothetical protein [Sediminicoccus sp. KRV36]|uniref:hypothetical protein n=1 Tax=Sediminicoccus sp. KRV36 TaxID=3133721 RepID=UPI00200F2D15|nr:hypothetical protein [Sediminicoccus rosea]UPY36463.1 hypothetical protein LHU95_19920 [Sediminicoccus rosea]